MTIQKMANNLNIKPIEVYWLVPAILLYPSTKNVFASNESVARIEILNESLALEHLPNKRKKIIPFSRYEYDKRMIAERQKEKEKKDKEWAKLKKEGRYCEYCEGHFTPTTTHNIFCKPICCRNYAAAKARKKTRENPIKRVRRHPNGFNEAEDQIFNVREAKKEAVKIMECSTECLLRELGDIE